MYKFGHSLLMPISNGWYWLLHFFDETKPDLMWQYTCDKYKRQSITYFFLFFDSENIFIQMIWKLDIFKIFYHNLCIEIFTLSGFIWNRNYILHYRKSRRYLQWNILQFVKKLKDKLKSNYIKVSIYMWSFLFPFQEKKNWCKKKVFWIWK